MALPDATPTNLFPEATPAHRALPRTGGSFGPPNTAEFPMFTDPDEDTMTAFGSMVESDLDPDLFDARVSHMRDAQYEPVFYAPDVSRVVPVSAPVTLSSGRGWRTPVLVFLAVFALSVVAGFAAVVFLTR